MYLILNKDLRLGKDDVFEDEYEISIPISKNIILEIFDIENFNKCLIENYALGEDIHVYLIEDNTLSILEDSISNKNTYIFKVKKEVPFKILKNTSIYLEENNFMMYKFCSSVNSLACTDNWDRCVEGLISSLSFFKLMDVYIFLKGTIKTSHNIKPIRSAIEKIEENLILKSFDESKIDFKYYLMLINNNPSKLLVSRLKLSIYENIRDLSDIINLINFLKEYNKEFLIPLTYTEILDKIIIIRSMDIYSKKEFFSIYDDIYTYLYNNLKNNNLDSMELEKLNTIILKNNKKLYF